jgi:hypothetical protein
MIFWRRADTACFLFRSSLQNPNRLSLPPIFLSGGSSRLASLFFSSFLCVLVGHLGWIGVYAILDFRCRIPLLNRQQDFGWEVALLAQSQRLESCYFAQLQQTKRLCPFTSWVDIIVVPQFQQGGASRIFLNSSLWPRNWSSRALVSLSGSTRASTLILLPSKWKVSPLVFAVSIKARMSTCFAPLLSH